MLIEKVESLNNKIDILTKKKNKADAQKEVWEKKLVESLEEYKKAYGVDLSAGSFKGIKEKLSKEIERVEAQTAEEYAKAEKIVNLIESGDIKGAWMELGVDIDAVEESDNVEPEVEEPVAPVKQEGLQGVESAISDIEEEDFDEGDLFGTVVEEEEKPEPVKEQPKMMGFGSLSFDDDEEDEFVEQETEKKGIVMDDDDDDGFGSFGGFGDILKGSKFQVGDDD